MYKQKKIVVLGGGADQIDLIKDLKKRGFYTVLVDYYENPIAKPYADKHVHESTLDMDKVVEICKAENAVNVITACTDQALLTVAYVAEKLGYPTQFSFEQAKRVTNKLYMKKVMWENNIPTSRFVDVTSSDDPSIQKLHYPLMVKPADCNGSFGIRKAGNKEELDSFFEYAANASRTKSVIVEEFKEGIEVGIDYFVQDGKARILMMGQVNKKKINDNINLIFQTFIPAQISDKAKENIQNIADSIAKAFDLDNTPVLLQTIVNGDDVSVIEFAPRIGGAAKHRTVHIRTGFDLLHANVGCVWGERPDIKTIDNPYFYSRNHIYCYPCTFDHIDNYQSLLDDGTIEELITIKTPGMAIGNSWASRERVGSFLVKALTMDELKAKINKAISTIQVINSEGRNVINQDIYK